MKKTLFIGVAAIAMLASCSNDEVVDQPKGNAIAFSAFVDNATRVDALTKDNLWEFDVYGFVEDMNGKLFDQERVSKDESGKWTYEHPQYWIADKSYWFQAFAPNSANYTFTAPTGNLPTGEAGTVSFSNSGLYDFCVATANQICKATGNTPVTFTFKHLLSRVKFTFANGFDSNNITIVVSNVLLKDVHSQGTMDLGTNTWTVTGGKGNMDMLYRFGTRYNEETTGTIAKDGSVASEYKFLIPANPLLADDNSKLSYRLTFKVQVYQSGVKVWDAPKEYNAYLPAIMEDGASVGFKRSYSYNFTVTLNNDNTLNGEPIEFTVTDVEAWGGDNAGTVTVPQN